MKKWSLFLSIGVLTLAVLMSIAAVWQIKVEPHKVDLLIQNISSHWQASHKVEPNKYWHPLVYLLLAIPVFIALGVCLRWLGNEYPNKEAGSDK